MRRIAAIAALAIFATIPMGAASAAPAQAAPLSAQGSVTTYSWLCHAFYFCR
ncbi:hypothetical protein NBM05_02840 [Rothia sp. AR01]|uniref:Uncharacterized protein n=1 Tax=Rothia santali TaxID=2949643 RepID=A0A9X2H8H2_9MICC|nr:hypothetical protein [Rothia santali]MCP3424994.1 hypothetical protein [Rothia santali]